MKFLLDENIGKKIANFLNNLGYSTYRLREINPGIEDFAVLELAISINAVVVTSDKDFGELVFKEGYPHTGVILLRLKDQSSENKIKALKKVLSTNKDLRNFLVVTARKAEFKIRTRKIN